jgi:hypothetical protein
MKNFAENIRQSVNPSIRKYVNSSMSPSKLHAKRHRASPPRETRFASRFASNAAEQPIEDAFTETPPIISPEEKHQMILAHSLARAPRDPLQRATLWGGVAIAFAAILGGWFFTVGHEVKLQITSSGNMDALTQRLNTFTNTVQNPALQQRTSLTGPTSEADAAEFAGMLQGILGTTSTPPVRNDLIAPAPTSATPAKKSTSSTKTIPTQNQGLVPADQQ